MKKTALLIGTSLLLGACVHTATQIDQGAQPGQQEEASEANAVTASNQPAGTQVTVDSASLVNSGYIVIHRADAAGKPGKVIGNSRVMIGDLENIVINLTESVSAGDQLFAMLHTDDGDQQYEFPGPDEPTKDDQGNIVLSKFSIAGDAMEKGDAMEDK